VLGDGALEPSHRGEQGSVHRNRRNSSLWRTFDLVLEVGVDVSQGLLTPALQKKFEMMSEGVGPDGGNRRESREELEFSGLQVEDGGAQLETLDSSLSKADEKVGRDGGQELRAETGNQMRGISLQAEGQGLTLELVREVAGGARIKLGIHRDFPGSGKEGVKLISRSGGLGCIGHRRFLKKSLMSV
jgi:hypothetical protein